MWDIARCQGIFTLGVTPRIAKLVVNSIIIVLGYFTRTSPVFEWYSNLLSLFRTQTGLMLVKHFVILCSKMHKKNIHEHMGGLHVLAHHKANDRLTISVEFNIFLAAFGFNFFQNTNTRLAREGEISHRSYHCVLWEWEWEWRQYYGHVAQGLLKLKGALHCIYM